MPFRPIRTRARTATFKGGSGISYNKQYKSYFATLNNVLATFINIPATFISIQDEMTKLKLYQGVPRVVSGVEANIEVIQSYQPEINVPILA